jgi:hypothetical protein
MQSNDELRGLAIVQTTNETALEDLVYGQVYVNGILCITNQPFEDKLEQLKAVFQRLSLNANALHHTRAA